MTTAPNSPDYIPAFRVKVGDDGRSVYAGDDLDDAIDHAIALSETSSLRKAEIRTGRNAWLATFRDGELERAHAEYTDLVQGI